MMNEVPARPVRTGQARRGPFDNAHGPEYAEWASGIPPVLPPSLLWRFFARVNFPWPERAPQAPPYRQGQGAQYERNFLFGKPRPIGGELHYRGNTKGSFSPSFSKIA